LGSSQTLRDVLGQVVELSITQDNHAQPGEEAARAGHPDQLRCRSGAKDGKPCAIERTSEGSGRDSLPWRTSAVTTGRSCPARPASLVVRLKGAVLCAAVDQGIHVRGSHAHSSADADGG
jgi:hypothetical protein